MSILAILALVIICAASGRVWFTLLATPERLDALEAWGASLALGVAFNGWLGLLLAEIGFFSVWWLGLVNAAIILLGFGRYRQVLGATDLPIPRREAAVLAVWLLVAIVLFFRPHQFLTGGADAGVYVNLAAQIAHSGTITMYDETLALIDPALYPALLRPQPEWFADPYYWLPAFNVPDQSGTIVPRFYHLAPVWQAAGYQLGGLDGLLYLTPLWALLGSSIIYLTMRRLWSWPWAAVGLWGLTLNALQVWFARYPTTEALTQYLMWMGVWGFICWAMGDYRPRLWAVVAGVGLGSTFLTRIDTFFLLIVPAMLFVYLLGQRRLAGHHLWFFVPITLLPLHSAVHGWLFSQAYFQEIFGWAFLILNRSLGLVMALAVAGGLFIFVYMRWQQTLINLIQRYQRPLRLLTILLICGWAIYNWFIRPAIATTQTWQDWYGDAVRQQYNHENLRRLGWYLSPAGVWAAVVGAAHMVSEINKRTWALLLLAAVFTVLYISDMRSNALQIYVMRRLVPVVLPFFIIAAVALFRWFASFKQQWLHYGAWSLSAIWLGLLVWQAQPFMTQVDYTGLDEQLTTLAAQFPQKSIFIFNNQEVVGQGDFLGTPLALLYQRHTYTLRDPAAVTLDSWQTTLGRWQAHGYQVYWVEVPNGFAWPLEGSLGQPVGQYDIRYLYLEQLYEAPPRELVESRWQGTIYEVPPAGES